MKKFGFIGNDVQYRYVRGIHAEIGQYELAQFDVNEESELQDALSDLTYEGFLVTDRYKGKVIKYLDELTDDVRRSHSVSVIKRLPDGRLKGFNTDMLAFRILSENYFEGKKCLILGTGGAARSIALVLKEKNAESVVLVSKDAGKSKEKLGGEYEVTGYDRLYPYYDANVIINCTSVGSFPDIGKSAFTETRISIRLFTELDAAIDLIYNPYRTKFLQDARRLTGCRTKSGLDLVLVQSLAAKYIWLDLEYDRDEAVRVLLKVKRSALAKQLNIVAVGLPGSGKTTIFRRYAYELGLEFADTDEKTEEIMGRTIAEAISASGLGEEYFRAAEHKAVKELCSRNGTVIATGGGTVLNPVNRDILKANGIVVYVKRPLEMLDRKGRPLTINIDLSDLFNARDRIYRRVSDMTLINSRIFGEKREKTGVGNSYNYELKGFVYFMARKVQKYINELAADRWS